MKQARWVWAKIKADQITLQIITFTTGIVLGMIMFPTLVNFEFWSFATGLLPEIAGILFTILVLNTWADIRSRKELREQLYSDLHSHSNHAVLNALHRLREKDWLDGDYFAENNLQRANWQGTYIGGLNFEKAQLQEANFKQATILNSDSIQTVYFSDANLKNAQLEGANLIGAQLKGTDLFGAQLKDANLRQAQLEGANLIGAQLKGANLIGARLENANLKNAQLEGADLFGAQLKDANLRQAQLEGANLIGAQVENVIWCYEVDYPAILPDGTEWKPEEDMERFTHEVHPKFKATLAKINAIRTKLGYDHIE